MIPYFIYINIFETMRLSHYSDYLVPFSGFTDQAKDNGYDSLIQREKYNSQKNVEVIAEHEIADLLKQFKSLIVI